MDDHDLLVRIDERVCNLTKHFSNHIKHHWLITVPLIMAVVGLIVVFITK